MKPQPFILIFIFLGCNTSKSMKTPKSTPLEPKVTGIGGIFFFSDDPDSTKNWYERHLGIEVNE